MKTTNYEISKKLAEIGFNQQTDFYWYCYDDGKGVRHIADADGKGNFKSYDLETLLDALPHNFMLEKKIKFLKMNQSEIGYETESSPIYDYQLLCHRMKEESLADTAGRLIILLESKNLIKF
jgi:hypothetical protein